MENHSMVEGKTSTVEYLKFAAVLSGITAVSIVLAKLHGATVVQVWMRYFMGVFFLVFASFKLFGYRMFVEMFAGYDILAGRFKPYGYAYPFIELSLAGLYFTNAVPQIRDTVTLLIMAVSSVGALKEISRRSGIHCACLGNIIKLPLSTVSLVEDVGMGAMALAMLLLR